MEEGVEYYLPNNVHDYIDCGYVKYKDIKWIIQIPKEYCEETTPIIKKHLHTAEEPKCYKCGTKLEFTKHNLWYTWKCVNCNFVKRTFISPDRLKSRTKKKI